MLILSCKFTFFMWRVLFYVFLAVCIFKPSEVCHSDIRLDSLFLEAFSIRAVMRLMQLKLTVSCWCSEEQNCRLAICGLPGPFPSTSGTSWSHGHNRQIAEQVVNLPGTASNEFYFILGGGGCALKDRVLFIKVKIKIRILKICFENILDFL